MLKAIEKFSIIFLIAVIFTACDAQPGQKTTDPLHTETSIGQQIILGNGPISKDLIDLMIEQSKIRKGGYVVIIPTNYQIKSKSTNALIREFENQGIVAVHVFPLLANSKKNSDRPAIQNTDILAIENARIICILDGNEHQFMNFANKTQLKQSLLNARENGALIAGFGRSTSLFGSFRLIVKKDTSLQQSKIYLNPGLSLLKNAVVGDIQLLNQQQKTIHRKIQNKKITFIGLNKNSAIWISGHEAVVLKKPKVAFVPYQVKGSRLGQGESFMLDQ